MSISEAYIEIPSGDMGNVFGQMDANTKKIERTFQVSVIEREGRIKVVGAEAAVQKATSVLKQLQILGTDNNDDLVVVITATAWQELEGKSYRVDSDQCFVAMWFDRTLDELFVHAIKPLEKTTGFRMLRIDMAQFNDKICDRIVAEIRKSRFMIADVTGHRHAVYFEAGYAMGFGVPVIWTCQRSQIGECPNFDTRQYNHILWDTPEELVEKLDARISATVGRKI